MKLHIANYEDADRRSVLAGEDMPLGAVIKISGTNADEDRVAMKLADADSALLLPGKYAVSFKVSSDPLQVSSSTAPAFLGDHTVSISSGDQMVEVRRGAILEYDPSLLDDSLNPDNAGTLPNVGDALGIKGSLFCDAGVGGAITSPVIARVYDVVGGKVRIELV
jgi:hypothetical protein